MNPNVHKGNSIFRLDNEERQAKLQKLKADKIVRKKKRLDYLTKVADKLESDLIKM